ncbi:Auxin-repressed 12.5 kDa protein [Apostasia shenzhenica]|uniref:Auxin-repressed 12.5 kDa protein n=1 Tax=Apostasia shenzhenica TaxID=1088818 RepID=A0A2I0A608_9ASPA|nr:Auxin-repressed 12.5 kDa protein [Apostasia shenzhenica]
MGLLDKLWDDTLAGPRPETGLGRLRKPAPFFLRSNSGKGAEEVVDGGIARGFGEDFPEEEPRVTRSIMIKRPAGCPSPVGGTPPASPAGSTPPLSPFSGGKEWNRFRRKSSSDAYEPGVGGGKLAKSPYEM